MPLELTETETRSSSLHWDDALHAYIEILSILQSSSLQDFIAECRQLGAIDDRDNIFTDTRVASEQPMVLTALLIRILWRNLLRGHEMDEWGYPLRDEVLEAEEVGNEPRSL